MICKTNVKSVNEGEPYMPVQSYLTGEDLKLRNAWLKYTFFPLAFEKAKAPDDFISRDALINAGLFVKIYNVIKDGSFIDLDGDFLALSKLNFFRPADENKTKAQLFSLAPDTMAKFLADVCKVKDIYWDDVNNDLTVQEIKYFENETFLGKALLAANLFESAKNKPMPATPVVPQPTAQPVKPQTTVQAQPAAQAQQPAAVASPKPAAQSGSKLSKATAWGLLSLNKIKAQGAEIYWIKGKFLDANAKTSPRIHVSPLNAGRPLRIKYTSGQGFDDCILYFDNKAIADAFMSACVQKCPDPKVDKSAFELRKTTADPNGYFSVDTEFGLALIQASKLHEDLTDKQPEDPALLEGRAALEAIEALIK